MLCPGAPARPAHGLGHELLFVGLFLNPQTELQDKRSGTGLNEQLILSSAFPDKHQLTEWELETAATLGKEITRCIYSE